MKGNTCVIKMEDGTVHEGNYSCHLTMFLRLELDPDKIEDCGWKLPDGRIDWGHGDSIKER
jgi:hypothetical protein